MALATVVLPEAVPPAKDNWSFVVHRLKFLWFASASNLIIYAVECEEKCDRRLAAEEESARGGEKSHRWDLNP